MWPCGQPQGGPCDNRRTRRGAAPKSGSRPAIVDAGTHNRKNRDRMANPDRLTALDTTFLHLEDHSTAHMHVASVMVFEGQAPTPEELVAHVVERLHLVPRYRQRLAYVPLDQGRPMWTDDPHSDAVIAIIMTIMVFELKTPHGADLEA